jgi:hypothetical protein
MRLRPNYPVYPEEPLPEMVRALLNLYGCEARWWSLTGGWFIYDRSENDNVRFDICTVNDSWAHWLHAVRHIKFAGG